MSDRIINMFEEYLAVGPEDVSYLASIPQTTVGRYFYDHIQTFDPDQIAELCPHTESHLTFGQLLQQSRTLSVALVRLGCHAGDIVLLCFGNSYVFTSTMLACFWSGTICLPMNPFFTQEDYELQLDNFRPRVIITTKMALSKLQESCQNLNIYPVFIVMDADENFDFEEMGVRNLNDLWLNAYPDEENFQPFDLPEDALKDHCIMILCSSGSTGLPKGVRHTDTTLMFGTFTIKYIKDYFYSSDIVLLLSGGFWVSGVLMRLAGLSYGMTSIIMSQFSCEEFCTIIEKYKVTRSFLSPSIASALVKFNTAAYDLSSLRLISFGGAAMSENLIQIAQQNLGAPLQSNYGMTEILLTMEPFFNHTDGMPSSVGKCVPGSQAKIISPETGLSLPPNERGELCIRAPSVMQGYHNNVEATEEAIDQQNWLHTGDIAYYDEHGWFFVVDRIKELIKYKGFHVAGSEIEAVLIMHPDIREVCVVGIPHETDWEHPKAFVVLTPEATATETDLVQFVEERMPDYKQLHAGVQFLKELPKTTTGKIQRTELRKISMTS